MKLEAEVADKNSIHYEDTATSWKAEDGTIMKELSSACIFPISFSMKLDKFYRSFIEADLEERRVL
jgi:hypothetical protein